MAFNKVLLTGNITRDVEYNTTTTGMAVCKFSLAVQRKFKNAEGKHDTDFFNIVAFKTLADLCHNYVKKGSKIGIIGSIQNRSWKDKEGNTKYATDIIADEVEFLSSKGEDESKAPEKTEKKSVQQKIAQLEPVEESDEMPF